MESQRPEEAARAVPRCPALKITDEREGEREVEREGQREMEREKESFKLLPLKTANDENGEGKNK